VGGQKPPIVLGKNHRQGKLVRFSPFTFAVEPLKILPFAVPVMIAAVEAARDILNSDSYEFYSQRSHMLVIFDIIFIVVFFWLFEFILDEKVITLYLQPRVSNLLQITFYLTKPNLI